MPLLVTMLIYLPNRDDLSSDEPYADILADPLLLRWERPSPVPLIPRHSFDFQKSRYHDAQQIR